MENRVDLSERLINFGVSVIIVAEKLPNIFAVKHLAAQLTRSGTARCLSMVRHNLLNRGLISYIK